MHGSKTVFKITNPPTKANEIDWFRRWFAKIVGDLKGQAHDYNQIGFTLESLSFKGKGQGTWPLNLPLRSTKMFCGKCSDVLSSQILVK